MCELENMTKAWPVPTVEPPTQKVIAEWMFDLGEVEATDGCVVEPDGVCRHGHPSWLLVFGLC